MRFAATLALLSLTPVQDVAPTKPGAPKPPDRTGIHRPLRTLDGTIVRSVSDVTRRLGDRWRRHREDRVHNGGPTNDREMLFLFFVPEVCDSMGVEDSLEGSPDLLTRAASYDFQGLEPPEAPAEPDSIILREYDTRGNLTRQERTAGTSREVVRCQYDRDNNLIAKHTESSSFPEPLYRATYSGPGLRDEEAYDYDVNRDGVLDRRFIARYTYDDRGRYVQQIRDFDNGADGVIEGRSTETVTYDHTGFRSRVVLDSDDDANGVVESRFTLYADRDRRGRLDSYGEELDADLDGTLDFWTKHTNTYDRLGRWVREVYEDDVEGRADGWADGIPDSRADSRLTQDWRGNVTSSSTSRYSSPPFASPDSYQEIFWEYDHRNQVTRQVTRTDGDADGAFEYTDTVMFTYDHRGRLIDSLLEFSSIWSSTSYTHYTFEYGARGNLTQLVTTSYDGVETAASGTLITFEYTPRPRKLGS